MDIFYPGYRRNWLTDMEGLRVLSETPAIRKKNTKRPQVRDAEATRQDILAAAMAEFSEKGLDGAHVDNIAKRIRTTKPMIYYHFGSKAKLYAAVIEAAYGRIRGIEDGLHLDALPPAEALRRLVEVTFDYHAAHPEYVRLITVENIEHARHIAEVPMIVERNAIAIEILRTALERGEKAGVFRKGVDPLHLHLMISSFCFYRMSNRHTWKVLFERDIWEKESAEAQRLMIIEAVLAYLKPVPA